MLLGIGRPTSHKVRWFQQQSILKTADGGGKVQGFSQISKLNMWMKDKYWPGLQFSPIRDFLIKEP
jgi:hypothetical protein